LGLGQPEQRVQGKTNHETIAKQSNKRSKQDGKKGSLGKCLTFRQSQTNRDVTIRTDATIKGDLANPGDPRITLQHTLDFCRQDNVLALSFIHCLLDLPDMFRVRWFKRVVDLCSNSHAYLMG
jgi:hypothetical protein